MKQIPCREDPQLVKKFPAFYGTWSPPPCSLAPILSQISSVAALAMDFMKMHLNILTFMVKSSKWSLSVRLSYQNFAGIFSPPMYNVCPVYLTFLWFGCSNNVWVMSTDHHSNNLQFLPVPCDLIPVRPRYLSQRHVLGHLQPVFLPHCVRFDTHTKQQTKL
jgi:hypothetical protein